MFALPRWPRDHPQGARAECHSHCDPSQDAMPQLDHRQDGDVAQLCVDAAEDSWNLEAHKAALYVQPPTRKFDISY